MTYYIIITLKNQLLRGLLKKKFKASRLIFKCLFLKSLFFESLFPCVAA